MDWGDEAFELDHFPASRPWPKWSLPSAAEKADLSPFETFDFVRGVFGRSNRKGGERPFAAFAPNVCFHAP